MNRFPAAAISIALSLITGHVVGSLGALKIWTTLQSQRNARDKSTSHTNDGLRPSSWAIPRARIVATTQVALATSVLVKLVFALAPSYNGPWSLVFISQIVLFVGGMTIACQSVAFGDTESVVGALLGIYRYEMTVNENGENAFAVNYGVKALERPEEALGSSLETFGKFPVVGTLISHGISAALCIGAFILESHICVGVLFVLFLANEVQRAPLRNVTTSTRQACRSSLKIFEKFAETIACVYLFDYLLFDPSTRIFGGSLRDLQLDASMPRETAYILFLCSWCYLCFVSTSSLALVTLALKIDYWQDTHTTEKQSEQEETQSDTLTVPIVLNWSNPPNTFPKPYYKSSIVSLPLSTLASYAVIQLIPSVLDLHSQLVLFAFVVVSSLNGIIFILLSIVLQAWRLGEVGFVWSFNEDQMLSRIDTDRKLLGRADSAEFLQIQERMKTTDSNEKAGDCYNLQESTESSIFSSDERS